MMWFHLERKGTGYATARSGVAVPDRVTGAYVYRGSLRPNAEAWPRNIRPGQKVKIEAAAKHRYPGGDLPEEPDRLSLVVRDFEGGQMARDQTLFVDDDGTAYHVYASEKKSTTLPASRERPASSSGGVTFGGRLVPQVVDGPGPGAHNTLMAEAGGVARAARPQRRRAELLIRALGDETVIYDLRTHQAHCLDARASRVWSLCDGRTSLPQITAALEIEGDPSLAAWAVEITLDTLRRARLLEPDETSGPRHGRRLATRRIAALGAAALLPVVISVLAPTQAQAATCVSSCTGQPFGTRCKCPGDPPLPDPCCNGTCALGSCDCSGGPIC